MTQKTDQKQSDTVKQQKELLAQKWLQLHSILLLLLPTDTKPILPLEKA